MDFFFFLLLNSKISFYFVHGPLEQFLHVVVAAHCAAGKTFRIVHKIPILFLTAVRYGAAVQTSPAVPARPHQPLPVRPTEEGQAAG
jgi:hypothetical protein